MPDYIFYRSPEGGFDWFERPENADHEKILELQRERLLFCPKRELPTYWCIYGRTEKAALAIASRHRYARPGDYGYPADYPLPSPSELCPN